MPRSNDCQTVAAHEASGGKSTERVQLQLHARVWTKTQLHWHARVWTKTQGRGRKLVAIQTVAPAFPAARGATTVRVAVHETSGGKVMAVWIAQSTCSCSRMRNSWQSRPRHVQQCVPHNQPTPCMRCSIRSTQSAAGSAGATVWIATSFRPRPCVFVHTLACRCSRTEFSSMPSHAAAAARALCSFHHSLRVRQLSDSRCSAARRGSTAPGRHGHQTTPR